MSSELSILALYGLLLTATILIEVLIALPKVGLPYLASARDEQRSPEGMAGRAVRANANAVVAMALFAPAVLVLAAQGAFTASTLLAAQIFLIARAAYVVIYLLGIPWLRTGVWMAGFLATVYLLLMAI